MDYELTIKRASGATKTTHYYNYLRSEIERLGQWLTRESKRDSYTVKPIYNGRMTGYFNDPR